MRWPRKDRGSRGPGTFVQTASLPGFPLGVKVYHQTALCDVIAPKIYLSNTAKIEWK